MCTQGLWELRPWRASNVICNGCVLRVSGSLLLQALVAEQESKDSGGAAVAEQVLSIMEIILDESNAEPLSEDKVSIGSSPSLTDTGSLHCLITSSRHVCV